MFGQLVDAHRFLFFRLGDYIYDHPKYTSRITAAICIILSLGLLNLNIQDSFRDGFFLRDSKSVEEHQKFLEFYNHTKMPYLMALVGECMEPNCTMLEEKYVLRMKAEVNRGLDIVPVLPSHHFNSNYSLPLGKYLIYSSEDQFEWLETYIKSNENNAMTLQYPFLSNHSERISVQQFMYGSEKGSVFALHFLMVFDGCDPAVLTAIKSAEIQWYKELQKRTDPELNLYLLGDALVDYEIQQSSQSAILYFVVGALLMTAVVYCIIWQYGQDLKVNIFLTFLTISCPTLAGAATMGLFALLGIPVTSIMMITPFLVLGVGVDDAFLLMHSWFYTQSMASARFCLMYTAVGPSILLSSLTNVVAFLVGYEMSPSADIAHFCLCTAVAFSLDWFLEILVFAPQLLIRCPGKAPLNSSKGIHVPKRYFRRYTTFLQNFSNYHILILLLLLSTHISCIILGMNMEENFTPEKTFDGDSFLAKSLAFLNKIYGDHQMVRILSTEMPENATVLRDDIKQISSFKYGCEKQSNWIESYDKFYHTSTTNVQKYFQRILNFILQFPEAYYYIIFDNSRVSKISFDFCLQGFEKWRDRAVVANSLRELLPERYSLFFYDSHIFDLILSIRGTILKAVLITVIIMVIICVFFLPDIRIATCTILSMLSITSMVIGGLRLWGAELDVVLMVNIIMVAGFTVDYISHISYNLFLEAELINMKRVDRMAMTLRAISGPTAQAAMTTIICVAPLLFHKVYMYVIFAKTIVLCSTVGLVHAIFVMPFLVSLVEMVFPSPLEEVNVQQLTTVAVPENTDSVLTEDCPSDVALKQS